MNERGLWDERYRQGSAWGAAPNQFVANRLAGIDPCRVLDLGSGQGRNAIWLARQGHEVTAVDVSEVASVQASDIAAELGLEAQFITADLQEWNPPSEEFDLVLLAYMQAPGSIRSAIHAKAAGALVPGGRVFIIAHHRDNLERGVGGPPSLEVLFDEEMIAGDFPGFVVRENSKVTRLVEKDGGGGEAIDLLFDATKPSS